jgi:hypothetical protein
VIILRVAKGVSLRVELRVLEIPRVVLRVLIAIINPNNKVTKLISRAKPNSIRVTKDRLPCKRNKGEMKEK